MSSESTKKQEELKQPDRNTTEIVKARISNLKCNHLAKEQVSKSLYVKISLVDRTPFTTSTVTVTSDSAVSWADTYTFEVPISSSIEIQVYQHRRGLLKDRKLGKFEGTVHSLFKESSGDITRELGKTGAGGVWERLPTAITFTFLKLAQDADIARLGEEEARSQAKAGLDQMASLSVIGTFLQVDGMAGQAVDDAESFCGIWEAVLNKLEVFTDITELISEVHPYAQIACSVLSAVPKALIAQRNRDDSIYGLMKTIDDMHSFVNYAEPLRTVESHRKMMENMSRLTMESAYFIRDYTDNKNFWTRFAKFTLSDVDAQVKQFSDKFEELQTDFAKRMDITIYRCLKDVESRITQDIILDGMLYAAGAGYDPEKSCIPGTRAAILADLHNWINKSDIVVDGPDTPRIMVLAGVAGCGKSAIAHTIAQYYEDLKRLGSCFCFSHADQLARGPGNILSTIAKDIANLDPQWKLSLYNAVQNNDSLRKSAASARQMKDLILGPANDAPITGPTVIVIDALDESGNTSARKSLLQVLSKSASELPGNFRILVTTRPEDDIIKAFSEKPHIELRYVNTKDEAAIDDDIAQLVKRELADIAHILEVRWPNGQWIILLVNASGHLFQWAATACRAILDGLQGYHPTERLEKFVKDASGLDSLYMQILQHTFNENDERVVSRFKRVFGGILAAKEPLSINSHSALQRISDHTDDVRMIVQPLGSLLHGTAQLDSLILALHASFFDFLKDEECSKVFFVDPTQIEHRFVIACLGVMKDKLRFNICDLPTSHLHNTDAPDMQDRVGRSIPPHLLYACRFFGTHLEATSYETRVRDELRVFLYDKLLFWLEVLSLTQQMNSATRTLASIVNWSQTPDFNLDIACSVRNTFPLFGMLVPRISKPAGRVFAGVFAAQSFALIFQWSQKYPSDITAFASDAIRFVHVFMPPISQSAPHIYLSALAFAPSDSLVSRMYLPRYPSTMRLNGGKLDQWPVELKTFEGHSDTVSSLAYSPDGTHIVSGSWDKTVRVWDAETGAVTVGPLRGHTEEVYCVTYSPDGKGIASGTRDCKIQVWDAETGEMSGSPFEGHYDSIYSIAYSPDGKRIASGSGDCTVQVWNIETGEAVGSPLEGHTEKINYIAYSPDGKFIASGSDDCTVRVWNTETGEAVGLPYEGHTKKVNYIVYSPDGKFVASGSDDCTVRVWSAETGEAVGSPFEGHSREVLSVAYFPDGKHIVSGSSDNTIRVWDAKTGRTMGVPLKGHSSWIRSIACSPDGMRIASASDDGTIRVWDAEIANREAVEPSPQIPFGELYPVLYSPDGESIISGDLNGVIRVWDVETGKAVGAPFEGHREFVYSIAYSPDGTCIVSGSEDKTIRLWDLKTGKEMGPPLEGHSDTIWSVKYSPDGKCIVSGSDDGTIRIWDAVTGELVLLIEGGKYRVLSVTYSPDGASIVSGDAGGTIQLWNAATGEAVIPFEGHTDRIYFIAYSPDGKRIASGSGDCTIRVWDAKTGKAIGSPFKGHNDGVRSIAYSPNGAHIVSGSFDNTIWIWDAETGVALRAPFKVHLGSIMSVAFSPDGKHVVSGSLDNTIRVWEVDSVACTSESATGFTHDSTLDNGWIMTSSSELLLWVPSWHRLGLVWPNNTIVIAPSLTKLDLSNFVHGSAWQQCGNTLQIAS